MSSKEFKDTTPKPQTAISKATEAASRNKGLRRAEVFTNYNWVKITDLYVVQQLSITDILDILKVPPEHRQIMRNEIRCPKRDLEGQRLQRQKDSAEAANSIIKKRLEELVGLTFNNVIAMQEGIRDNVGDLMQALAPSDAKINTNAAKVADTGMKTALEFMKLSGAFKQDEAAEVPQISLQINVKKAEDDAG